MLAAPRPDPFPNDCGQRADEPKAQSQNRQREVQPEAEVRSQERLLVAAAWAGGADGAAGLVRYTISLN